MYNPGTNRISEQLCGCVPQREFCFPYIGFQMYIMPLTSLGSTLEDTGEGGNFTGVILRSSPKEAKEGTKGGLLSLLDLLTQDSVESTLRPPGLNRGSRRCRYGQRSTVSERTSQLRRHETLEHSQVTGLSFVSSCEGTQMIGISLHLQRLRGAWKCACKPAEGKCTLDTKSSLKPQMKTLRDSVVVDKPGSLLLLQGTSTKLVAQLLQRLCSFEPSVPPAGTAHPTTKCPRTRSCSETTRDKSSPNSIPKLFVLHKHSRTGTTNQIPPPTSHLGGWGRSGNLLIRHKSLNSHKRVRR